jgi:hypothetical protein
MKLQDQCCTREQGHRLVELGIKPDALFWWMPAQSGPHGEYIQYGFNGNNLAPAFNVAELGKLLPVQPNTNTTYSWYHRYNWKGHSVGYSQNGGTNHIEIGWYETEAQARAALLIDLLENNLMP